MGKGHDQAAPSKAEPRIGRNTRMGWLLIRGFLLIRGSLMFNRQDEDNGDVATSAVAGYSEPLTIAQVSSAPIGQIPSPISQVPVVFLLRGCQETWGLWNEPYQHGSGHHGAC